MKTARVVKKITLTVMDIVCTMAEVGDVVRILESHGNVHLVASEKNLDQTFYATSDQIEVFNDSQYE